MTAARECLTCGALGVDAAARFCRLCGSTLDPGRPATTAPAADPAVAAPAPRVDQAPAASPTTLAYGHPNGYPTLPAGYYLPGPTPPVPAWMPVPTPAVPQREAASLAVGLSVLVLVTLIAFAVGIILLVSRHDSTSRGVVTVPHLSVPAVSGG